MIIYVAGKYSAKTEKERLENTKAAIDIGIEILAKGHYPFIPHLSHWVDKYANETNRIIPYEKYLEWDNQFLVLCDGLYFINHSKGADKELALAKRLRLKIFYKLDDIPEYATF